MPPFEGTKTKHYLQICLILATHRKAEHRNKGRSKTFTFGLVHEKFKKIINKMLIRLIKNR